MSKYNKIYVKIQIEKNQDSGDLMIGTHFDPDAPNFSQDKEGISWYPTPAEIEFINEAFELIPKHKNKDGHFVNKGKKEKTVPSSEYKVEDTETPKTQDNSFDNPDKDVQVSDETSTEKKEEDKGIIVTADVRTIDEVLKRKKDESDGVIVEADEGTIIDKVLRQKKKGKL